MFHKCFAIASHVFKHCFNLTSTLFNTCVGSVLVFGTTSCACRLGSDMPTNTLVVASVVPLCVVIKWWWWVAGHDVLEHEVLATCFQNDQHGPRNGRRELTNT